MATNVGGSFETWLEALGADADLTPTARGLLHVIAQNPERASYASTRALATMARIDVSNVTRLAQAIGYAGWPELRAELRSRYLSTLSLSEIGDQHRDPADSPASTRSVEADRRALALLRPDPGTIAEVVEILAAARQRLTIGGGTYGVAAQVLASHCTFAGYPTTFAAEGAALVNGLARLGEGDVLVAFGLWRHYRSISDAVRTAKRIGAATVVITDVARSSFTEPADHVILASSEGGSHFPTMVPSLAIVNLLTSELAQRDPERTRAALSHHEAMWDEMHILARDG